MLGGDTSSSSGAKPPCFAHGWSDLAWEVDGRWRVLGQMWLVLMCPRGVFSCPLLFHPESPVAAQGAMISSLRDFLLFGGEFCLILELCGRACRVMGFLWGVVVVVFLLIEFRIL